MDPNVAPLKVSAPTTPDRRSTDRRISEKEDSNESPLLFGGNVRPSQEATSEASSSREMNMSLSGLSPSALMSELVDRAGIGWYQIMVIVPLLGVTFQEYAQVQVLNSIVSALQLEWGLTRREKALLPSLGFLGLALGTFLSGFLADTIGRRKTVILGFATTTCTILLVSRAESYLYMVTLAVLNGIASGLAVPAKLANIAEICPKEIRPVIFVFPMFAQVMGEVYSTTVLSIFMPDLLHGNWRTVVLVVGIPTFILLLLSYALLDESPMWLVVQGKHEQARDAILKIAMLNGRLRDVEELSRDLLVESPTTQGATIQAQPTNVWSSISNSMKSMRFNVVAFGCAYLCVVGQLLTFGSGYLWPEMLRSVHFRGAHVRPAVGLSLIRSFGVPCALLMIPVMRSTLGHRHIIGIAALGEVLALNVCIVAIQETTQRKIGLGDWVIVLAGVSLACANFLYTTVCLYVAESFPTSLRAVMLASCICIGRIGALAGPELVESLGFAGFMAFASGSCCVLLVVLLTLKETKGRPMVAEGAFDVKVLPGGSSGGEEPWYERVQGWLVPRDDVEEEQNRRLVAERFPPVRASPDAKRASFA